MGQSVRSPAAMLAGFSVVTHRAQEVMLTAGSKTGSLLFLRSGTVEVIKDGVQIASVNAPGSVGEQAVLLDQLHTADVRTLEQSEFYVADARRFLLVIQPSPSTSPQSLRDDWTPPTDGLSRLSARFEPESLPA